MKFDAFLAAKNILEIKRHYLTVPGNEDLMQCTINLNSAIEKALSLYLKVLLWAQMKLDALPAAKAIREIKTLDLAMPGNEDLTLNFLFLLIDFSKSDIIIDHPWSVLLCILSLSFALGRRVQFHSK